MAFEPTSTPLWWKLFSSSAHILAFCVAFPFINTFFTMSWHWFLAPRLLGRPTTSQVRANFFKANLETMSEETKKMEQRIMRKTTVGRRHAIIRLDLFFCSLLFPIGLFISLLQFPGFLLLCFAHIATPPRVATPSATRQLCRYYPRAFAESVVVIPAGPHSKHPIIRLVNLVMGGAMKDDDDNYDDAGAFALFNMVFTTMSTEQRGATLIEEDNTTTFVHECVHVRQQGLSTSVLSFLVIYLSQYLWNFFRLDRNLPASYVEIAAERQAYCLENSPPVVADVDAAEQRFMVWDSIGKDFFFDWL